MSTDPEILKEVDAMQPLAERFRHGLDSAYSKEQLDGAVSRGSVHRLVADALAVLRSGPIAEVLSRVEAVERKLGIVRSPKPIKRSVTNVLKHDDQGRVEQFEKFEGGEEEIDLVAKLMAIEKRLAEVGNGFTYEGVWKRDRKYSPGQFVTDRGAMWSAKAESTGVKPGDGLCWQLAVKAGRDAR